MQSRRLGIVLIVIGIIMIIFAKFNYVTDEKMVDSGSTKINKEKYHPVQRLPVKSAVLR